MHSYNRTLIAKLGFADPDKKDSKHDLACQYLAEPEQHIRLAKSFHNDLRTTELSAWERFVLDWNSSLNNNRIVWADDERPVFSFHIQDNPTEAELKAHARSVEKLTPFTRELKSATQVPYKLAAFTRINNLRTPQLERAVNKGDGNYKSTVGFIDVALPYHWSHSAPATVSRDSNFAEMLLASQDGSAIPEIKQLKRLMVHPERESGNEQRPGDGSTEIVVEVKIAPVPAGDILRQMNLYKEFYGGIDSSSQLRWVVATAFDLTKEDVRALTFAKIKHIRLGDNFKAYLEKRAQTKHESSCSEEI